MAHIRKELTLGAVRLVRFVRGGAQGFLIMVLPSHVVRDPNKAHELAGVGEHGGHYHGYLDPASVLANVGPLARLHEHGRRGEHRKIFDRTP